MMICPTTRERARVCLMDLPVVWHGIPFVRPPCTGYYNKVRPLIMIILLHSACHTVIMCRFTALLVTPAAVPQPLYCNSSCPRSHFITSGRSCGLLLCMSRASRAVFIGDLRLSSWVFIGRPAIRSLSKKETRHLIQLIIVEITIFT